MKRISTLLFALALFGLTGSSQPVEKQNSKTGLLCCEDQLFKCPPVCRQSELQDTLRK